MGYEAEGTHLRQINEAVYLGSVEKPRQAEMEQYTATVFRVHQVASTFFLNKYHGAVTLDKLISPFSWVEISSLLSNLKFLYRVHKRPPLLP
jgi:hypothetical protein